MDTQRLPGAEKTDLDLGYLRLTDSAPLIIAREKGFFQRYGLGVALRREVSWANIRDKLVTGDLDAAQMLAPLPLATSLGLGGMRAEVVTGLILSLNGNAVTLGEKLAGQIDASTILHRSGARATAVAMGQHLRQRERDSQLVFASAHYFSCHTFLLRHWLRAGGIDPNSDVRIIVLPPEQMVDSLSRGVIDGFCVGEPWNTMAVQYGVGCVAASGYQIWNNGPEKVLGVTEHWHQRFPGSHLRLRLALMEACRWLGQPENSDEAVDILARPEYLDLPREVLLPSMSSQFVPRKGGEVLEHPDFHVFHRFQAGFPWRSDGEWLLRQTGALVGKNLSSETIKSLVQRTYRTDLYREAARYLQWDSPTGDYKPINVHAANWALHPGIEMGPDLLLQPAPD